MLLLPLLLLVFFAVCVAIVIVVGTKFLDRKGILIAFGTCVVLLTTLFVYAELNKQSYPGRTLRFLKGSGLAQQYSEDEAVDLRGSTFLAELQKWSADTVARYQAGQVAISTNQWPKGDCYLPFPFAIQLASSERPSFMKQRWGAKDKWNVEDWQVYVLLSSSGKAEAATVAWYSHGLVIGGSNYQLSFDPWTRIQVAAGTYGYTFSK